MEMVPKIVQPVEDQSDYESRKYVLILYFLLTSLTPPPSPPPPSPHIPHLTSLTPPPSPHLPHPTSLTHLPHPTSLTLPPSPHLPHPTSLTPPLSLPLPSPHLPHPSHLTSSSLTPTPHRLWKNVTRCLKANNVDEATTHKHFLEERQRAEAKLRKENNSTWKTKVCGYILCVCVCVCVCVCMCVLNT